MLPIFTTAYVETLNICDSLFRQVENIALCLKKYHKNCIWHLFLVKYIFIKHSQNVCLINTHILMYRYARYNFQLWKVHWLFYCIFLIFSNIIDEHVWFVVSSPNIHRMLIYIFLYINLPNVSAYYGKS